MLYVWDTIITMYLISIIISYVFALFKFLKSKIMMNNLVIISSNNNNLNNLITAWFFWICDIIV